MGKRALRRIGASTGVAIVMAAIGAPASATNLYVQDKVRNVYPLGDGSFVITFVNPQTSCPSGSAPQYFYVTPGQNGVNADGAKSMLATALTAFATGTRITLVFDNATSYCYVNRLSLGD